MKKKPIKLLGVEDHVKESLKDPVSKAIFDTWGEAIRDEIKPRDKEIDQLFNKLKKVRAERGALRESLKKLGESFRSCKRHKAGDGICCACSDLFFETLIKHRA